MPSNKLSAVAYAATFSDRASAVQAISMQCYFSKKLWFLEAVFRQDGLCLRRLQIADKTLRFGRVAAALDGGDWISDGRIERDFQHHLDLVFHDGGIGAIHEARIDFTARYIVQRLAHVLRADGFG